jgi:hypothetical protein
MEKVGKGMVKHWGSGFPPASRLNNPQTSSEAELEMNESGSRETHVRKVLKIVTDQPGLITGEIGELSGLGHMETRKRLSDLKNKELIYQGKSRVWEHTKRNQASWYPAW